MAIFRPEWSRIHFSYDLPMTQHHDTMNLCTGKCHERIEQGCYLFRRHALRLRRGALQTVDLSVCRKNDTHADEE